MQIPKPKKYLGQHFLVDKHIAGRIVDCLVAGKEEEVIEIGPGRGILTDLLLARLPRLTAIEVDPEVVQYLQRLFQDKPLEIIEEDILKWDLHGSLDRPACFIGNLPYNISSPIFFKLLEHREKVREGVFMIQKEVADRICSQKGNKVYGILSVLMGYYFDLKLEFKVPPSVFVPPPRVMSAVIRIVRKEQQEEIAFKDFKLVVKTAFNQRRKTLRNALKKLQFENFEGRDALFSLRAEALGTAEFVTLTQHLL